MARILIVDDDSALAETLRDRCAERGHTVTTVDRGERCLPQLDSVRPDLIFLDVRLGDADGLELLRRIKERRDVPVAIMTGHEPLTSASRAGAGGAEFFLRKPFGLDEVDGVLGSVERSGRPVRMPDAPAPSDIPGVAFVGVSRAMLDVCRSIGLAARSGATTLISGESGVGKELAARAIHALAGPQRPFAAVDCTTLVETLFESELFGHERGAFTGAIATRPGKLEMARGGTLFLDEAGELTPRMQAKLLRVLQYRTFERVGSNEPIHIDFHLVAATNRDLERLAKEGAYRADLLYRLDVLHVHIPPLRERREDIPPLIRHLTETHARRDGRALPEVTAEAMDVLVAHDWPGNVRQLENVLLRCAVHSSGGPVRASDVRRWIGDAAPASRPRTLAAIEREAVVNALAFARGNVSEAARILGISRPTLRRKMKAFGIRA